MRPFTGRKSPPPIIIRRSRYHNQLEPPSAFRLRHNLQYIVRPPTPEPEEEVEQYVPNWPPSFENSTSDNRSQTSGEQARAVERAVDENAGQSGNQSQQFANNFGQPPMMPPVHYRQPQRVPEGFGYVTQPANWSMNVPPPPPPFMFAEQEQMAYHGNQSRHVAVDYRNMEQPNMVFANANVYGQPSMGQEVMVTGNYSAAQNIQGNYQHPNVEVGQGEASNMPPNQGEFNVGGRANMCSGMQNAKPRGRGRPRGRGIGRQQPVKPNLPSEPFESWIKRFEIYRGPRPSALQGGLPYPPNPQQASSGPYGHQQMPLQLAPGFQQYRQRLPNFHGKYNPEQLSRIANIKFHMLRNIQQKFDNIKRTLIAKGTLPNIIRETEQIHFAKMKIVAGMGPALIEKFYLGLGQHRKLGQSYSWSAMAGAQMPGINPLGYHPHVNSGANVSSNFGNPLPAQMYGGGINGATFPAPGRQRHLAPSAAAGSETCAHGREQDMSNFGTAPLGGIGNPSAAWTRVHSHGILNSAFNPEPPRVNRTGLDYEQVQQESISGMEAGQGLRTGLQNGGSTKASDEEDRHGDSHEIFMQTGNGNDDGGSTFQK